MVRKVASLLRERNELNRRLSNVTGGALEPWLLACWLSEELWDVHVPAGSVTSGGPQFAELDRQPVGVFTAGALAGRTVQSVWVGCDEDPLAPHDADFALEYVASVPWEDLSGRLSVEQVRLVAHDGSVTQVFPENASPLAVPRAVYDALGQLSVEFMPALTRYH
jgi:hypothetical protein